MQFFADLQSLRSTHFIVQALRLCCPPPVLAPALRLLQPLCVDCSGGRPRQVRAPPHGCDPQQHLGVVPPHARCSAQQHHTAGHAPVAGGGTLAPEQAPDRAARGRHHPGFRVYFL